MRAWIGAGVLALLAGIVVLLMGPVATSATTAPTVKVATSDALGAKIVVDGAGRTLYRFTLERAKTIKCTAACTRTWPPVIVPRAAKPVAGAGIARVRLGTIARPDGRRQLTYFGFPLYRFAQDKRAGDVKGQGVGGNWFAVGPSGRLVKALPSPIPPGDTTPTPTTPDPIDPPPGY